MSDLSTLFKAAPGSAGFMMGQNNSLEQQLQQMRQQQIQVELQKLLQGMQDEKAKLPYELERLRLGNEQTAAQIPGFQAQSGLHQLDLNRRQALQPASIADEKDKMTHDQTMRGLERSNKFGSAMLSLAGELEGTEPALRGHVFNSWIDAKGFPRDDPSAKHFLDLVKRTHPNQLPALLKHIATEANKLQPAYTQATEVERMQSESREKVGAGHDAAQRYTADRSLEAARIRAAGSARAQKTDKELYDSLKSAAAKLSFARAKQSQYAGEDDELSQYWARQAATQEPQAARETAGALPPAGKPDPRTYGIPVNPPTSPLPPASTPQGPGRSLAPAGAALGTPQNPIKLK